jgi:hypothetical protein
MTNDQIKECAKELGYEFNTADCEDVLTTATWAYETVWDGVTDYLNAYESCTDFNKRQYAKIRNKWSKVK